MKLFEWLSGDVINSASILSFSNGPAGSNSLLPALLMLASILLVSLMIRAIACWHHVQLEDGQNDRMLIGVS
jgi:hypothetical protein